MANNYNKCPRCGKKWYCRGSKGCRSINNHRCRCDDCYLAGSPKKCHEVKIKVHKPWRIA